MSPTTTFREKPGCLTALLGWVGLGTKPQEEPSFPYHQRDDFLSPAEISFYHVLRTILGDEAVVCPKVSLGDLFYAATGELWSEPQLDEPYRPEARRLPVPRAGEHAATDMDLELFARGRFLRYSGIGTVVRLSWLRG